MSACDIQFNKLSDRVNQELYHLGYSVLGRLDQENLRQLKKETEEIKDEIVEWKSEGRLFALIDTYRSLFLRSNKMIETYVTPFIRQHFDLDQVEIHGASHFVKPIGKKGKFLCHQDSAIVEEPQDFSINAWMPLTSVNRINGCVWVLPGSHIYPFYTRYAGNNPYSDEKLQKLLWSKMIPVPVKAGEILLFHRSVFHGSSVNYLPFHRMAVESIIIPKNAQLIVNYRDEDVADDEILMFRVTKEHFFENEDPRGKLLREMKDFDRKHFVGNKYAVDHLEEYFPLFEKRAEPLLQPA
jgi:hypothetical protein